MKATAAAISLNVDDVQASANFLRDHYGFVEEMSDPSSFASLRQPDLPFNVIFLRNGLETFKPPALAGHAADGLLVVLVVEGIDAEYERIQAEGVEILTSIETEPWGERFFQVADPNGVVIQLVEWVDPPPAASES